jgi:hypothetical protein
MRATKSYDRVLMKELSHDNKDNGFAKPGEITACLVNS